MKNRKSIGKIISEGDEDSLSDRAKEAAEKNPGTCNLTPFDTDSATEAQQKSAESRRKKKEERELKAKLVSDFTEFLNNDLSKANLDTINTVTFMKFQMLSAAEEGDMERADDLAKTIAEFEQPKLARIDNTVREVVYENVPQALLDKFANGEISEEEFEAEAKKYC